MPPAGVGCAWPGCPCDLAAGPGVTVQDLLVYLQAWFARDPSADWVSPPSVDVSDLLAFLGMLVRGVWLTGLMKRAIGASRDRGSDAIMSRC